MAVRSRNCKALIRRCRPANPRRPRTAPHASTSNCSASPKKRWQAGAARWSRSIRGRGDVLVFASLPSFDPERIRPRHFAGRLPGAHRESRSAAVQPRAPRHLPAGLDHQARHGAGRPRIRHRQARGHGLLFRLFLAAALAPPVSRLEARGPRHDEHGRRRDAVLRRLFLPARELARHRAHPRLP